MFSDTYFWLNFLGLVIPVLSFWLGLEISKLNATSRLKELIVESSKAMILLLFASLVFGETGLIQILPWFLQIFVFVSFLYLLVQVLLLLAISKDKICVFEKQTKSTNFSHN
jgi:hypothetical protein